MQAQIIHTPILSRRPYALVGIIGVALITGLVLLAYLGLPALGVFTVASGMFGLAAIALVLAVGLGYVLFTLRGSLDEMRAKRLDHEARLVVLEMRERAPSSAPSTTVVLVTPAASVETRWTPLPARKGAHAERARETPAIEIEGIGEAYAGRLGEQGIKTVGELKAADPSVVAPAVRADAVTFDRWQSMADMMELQGVGKQYAELLVRAGVASVDKLAHQDAAKLLAQIELAQSTTNTGAQRQVAIQGSVIRLERVREWITEARRIV